MAEAKTNVATNAVATSEKHYAVEIPGNKMLTIPATSEGDAIQQYKKRMGIVATQHEASVSEVPTLSE